MRRARHGRPTAQNPTNNRPAEDALEAQRFADLTPAWTLQIIAPLIVIGLGFPLLARERESGLWRAIAGTGVGPTPLVAGKALSLGALSLAALSPPIIAGLAAPLSASAPTSPDHAARAAGLAGLYALYLAAIGTATLAVSAFAGATRNALAALAGLWILTAIVAPRSARRPPRVGKSSLRREFRPDSFESGIAFDAGKETPGAQRADAPVIAACNQDASALGCVRRDGLCVNWSRLALGRLQPPCACRARIRWKARCVAIAWALSRSQEA